MKKIISIAVAALAVTGAQANNVNVDFTTYAVGSTVTSAQGVQFAVQGSGVTGSAVIEGWGDNGLSNSTTGEYPTGSILDIKFWGSADNVSFTFDNYGSGNGSYYTAIGANGVVLGTGSLDETEGDLVSLGYSGVYELQLSNNQEGDNSWLFSVSSLSADVTAVPEASSSLMLLAGIGAMVGLARRRQMAK